jgi:hypothetical protein
VARSLRACAPLEEALVAPSLSTACVVGGCGFGAGTTLGRGSFVVDGVVDCSVSHCDGYCDFDFFACVLFLSQYTMWNDLYCFDGWLHRCIVNGERT